MVLNSFREELLVLGVDVVDVVDVVGITNFNVVEAAEKLFDICRVLIEKVFQRVYVDRVDVSLYI